MHVCAVCTCMISCDNLMVLTAYMCMSIRTLGPLCNNWLATAMVQHCVCTHSYVQSDLGCAKVFNFFLYLQEAFLQQEVEHRRRSMPVVLPSSTPGHVPCLEPIQQQVSVEPLSSPETPPLEEGLNSLNVGASEPDRELLYTTSCPQLKQQGASPQPFSRMTSASVRIPRKRPLTLPIRRNNSLPNHSASDSPSTGSSIGNVAVSVGVGVSFGVALYAYLYS